jgi:hypothetical protein
MTTMSNLRDASRREDASAKAVATGPIDDSPALLALKARRSELHRHNPRVLPAADRALQALREKVGRHTNEIRCEMPRRRRAKQLAGEKGLPTEDVVAIGMESPIGTLAVVDYCRELLRPFGFLVAEDPVVADVGEAAAAFALTSGALQGKCFAAMGDGKVVPAEASALLPEVERTEEQIATLKAALTDVLDAEARPRAVEGGRR